VNFRNFAFNFFGRTDQQIVVGVSAESHEKLIFHLDDALEKLSLTEEQKTEALVELTKSKGDLESITRIVDLPRRSAVGAVCSDFIQTD
jgi:hypothetical protein